ncbi:MAG: phosphoribosylformylglycinamidine cyclo-ligase [Firmicutes bacterium]|nr:phosphoribosylformylglycinamidine cyclo-ligase [Alicyclobacillaceae bacterium]MCL6497910.1 phosphoribosylformylglycinamidine cyclo-ligase [Bacillota bacterium]
MDYRQAGVDIEAGNEVVRRIRQLLTRFPQPPEVVEGIGGFAGRYRWQGAGDLVAGADGVGTKILLAQALDRFDTIGIDLVAMNVNDVLAAGGRPLFFLDYIAVGRVNPDRLERVLEGVAVGCQEAGCALLGGETAEMPDVYGAEGMDLAGFAVGEVIWQRPRDPAPGDLAVGLASSGFHANGFSLIRAIIRAASLDLDRVYPESGEAVPLGQALLRPTRIYVGAVLPLLTDGTVVGMAHITGGGLTENLPRALPRGLGVRLRPTSWPVPPLMFWLARLGAVPEEEMRRTFNCGLGFVLLVPPERLARVQQHLGAAGIPAFAVGEVVPGEGVEWA